MPRKPVPKRHGAAWGAQSPTSQQKRASESNSSDFGRYMTNKVRKLGEQFQASSTSDASKQSGITSIFKGVSIHVNGYTTPTHQELRDLMLKHGGNFENYFSKSRVTHIICSNLPQSKVQAFRSFSKGLPVVRPAWVVDSIVAGRLLPWTSYQLELSSAGSQKTLSSFFGMKRHHAAEETVVIGKHDNPIEIQYSEPERSASLLDTPDTFSNQSENLGSFAEEDGDSCISEGRGAETFTDNETRREEGSSMESAEHRTKHSTLNDPDFVRNYFKSSRLHFIGTWRNRYQGSSSNHNQQNKALRRDSEQQAVIHVDMDCFFVSVVTRNRPELAGKAVAVCHSDSSKGTAEISSANYEARAFGVRAGMFVRNAKELCPGLEVVPYDFEGYEQVAEKLYEILHRHSVLVQAVSCDEAFLDVTGMGDPAEIALAIRQEIFETTRCTASAGISLNILLSRLATKKAKPNGQYQIHPEQAKEFMAKLSVEELPGVGSSLREKLHGLKLFTCSDICSMSSENLRKHFGQKTGEMLWNYAHGVDDRKLQPAQERKSVGAEVNWGVRFSSASDAQRFLIDLSEEVTTRLHKAEVLGRTFTLKVKKRKAGVGEPVKFMGCGICDNISRSTTLPSATNQRDVILRVARQIFGSLNLDVREIRGVGLQVSKLEPLPSVTSLQGQKRLELWVNQKTESPGKKNALPNESSKPREGKADESSETRLPAGLPPASDIDPSVLASLPPDLFAELNEAYSGMLSMMKAPTSVASFSPVQDENESSGKIILEENYDRETPSGASSEETLDKPGESNRNAESDSLPVLSQASRMQKEFLDCIKLGL